MVVKGFEHFSFGLSNNGDTPLIGIIQATNDSATRASVEVCESWAVSGKQTPTTDLNRFISIFFQKESFKTFCKQLWQTFANFPKFFSFRVPKSKLWNKFVKNFFPILSTVASGVVPKKFSGQLNSFVYPTSFVRSVNGK